MAGIKRRLGSLLGPEGRVPQFVESVATHVAPHEPAQAVLTKIGEAEYRINFRVPRGLDGDPTAVANLDQATATNINTPETHTGHALDHRIREVAPHPFVVSTDENAPVGEGQILFVVDRPFHPLHLPLAWWFDASSLNRSDGAAVSQWEDLSGYARHVTQGDAPSAPTYRSAGVHGQPAVEFDGNSYLTSDTFDPIDAGITIFLVGQVNSPPDWHSFVDSTDSSNRAYFGAVEGDWYLTRGRLLIGSPADTAPHVFTAVMQNNDFRIRVDGQNAASRADAPISGQEPSSVRLGNRHDAASHAGLDGYISEAFMVIGPISESEMQAAETYLKEKWGL